MRIIYLEYILVIKDTLINKHTIPWGIIIFITKQILFHEVILHSIAFEKKKYKEISPALCTEFCYVQHI